ncbi:hypothetical protein NL676_037803 [Syzygium grande]|nr:hypothetical protein NL676_037803 [Syzygium grande]
MSFQSSLRSIFKSIAPRVLEPPIRIVPAFGRRMIDDDGDIGARIINHTATRHYPPRTRPFGGAPGWKSIPSKFDSKAVLLCWDT